MKSSLTARLALVLAAAGTAIFPTLPASAAVLTVKVGNFYYEDATVGDGRIVIDSGDQIRFVVQDGGPGTPHTVDIDEFGIHSGGIPSGETYTTKPLTTPGTYRLYCKPHQRRGHETTLIVRGSAPAPAPSSAAPQPSSQPASPTPAPRPTSAAPGTTTAPRPASSSPGTTTAQPAPAGATATAGSSGGTTGALPVSPAPVTTNTSRGSTSPLQPGGPTSDAAVAEGRGAASTDELDPGALGESSLEQALGRSLTSSQPWTRGVRIALLILVPMLLLAAWAVSRWKPDER